MPGGHGGRRAGAGRKRAPLIEPRPVQSLLQRLKTMPTGEAGLVSRMVFALAACGARDEEIAAVLGLSVALLNEWQCSGYRRGSGDDVDERKGRDFALRHGGRPAIFRWRCEGGSALPRYGISDMKGPSAFRSIGEVAAALDVPQHVLRFWGAHQRGATLRTKNGRRWYRPKDVELLSGMRVLLHVEGGNRSEACSGCSRSRVFPISGQPRPEARLMAKRAGALWTETRHPPRSPARCRLRRA